MTGKPLLSHEEVKAIRDARRETKAAMRQPLKQRNEKRGGERFPERREPERMAWIRTQPCVCCGKLHGEYYDGQHYYVARIEAAHMRSKGAAGDDSSALPVCAVHHRQGKHSQHRMGIKSWAEYHHLDIPALIAAHRKRYALEMAEKARK